jgi:hypothetical protein
MAERSNMSILFGKYSTPITIALLLSGVSLWQIRSARLMFAMILLLFSITRVFASVIAKHRRAHLRGRITYVVFVRNVLIEITGLLLAMILAGLLGQYLAQVITQPISNDLVKFFGGIATGLLVGIGVGVLMHHIWGRLDVCSTSREI